LQDVLPKNGLLDATSKSSDSSRGKMMVKYIYGDYGKWRKPGIIL
jgi:hypothetical protein